MGSGASNDMKTNFMNGNIQIKTDKTIYNPGDQVSGRIYLQIYSPLPPSTLSFRFYGVEFCGIVVQSQKGSGWRSKRQKIINLACCLHKWESQVPQGDYEVPFSFTLPQGLPSSFYQEGKRFMAHVTYNMIIQLEENEKPQKADTICKFQKLFIRKAIKRPSTSYTEQRKFPVRSWGCIPRGSITYKATFNKNSFSSGEKACLTLEIDNSQNKLMNTHINFRLVQLTTFGEQKIYDTKVNQQIQVNIPAGATPKTQHFSVDLPLQFKSYNHDLDIRDTTWPVGQADFGLGDIGQTTQGELIRSVYYLEILGGMDGVCSSDKRISCNIELIFPDPHPEHFYLPDTWYPQVLQHVMIDIDTGINLKSVKNVRKARDTGEAWTLENEEKRTMV